jgi:hypothetical protein
MATMRGDIVNRVRRLPKPSNASEALQPIFEAVSNALHAVEDEFGDQYRSKGQVIVTIKAPNEADAIEVTISDNGPGLSDERFEAFRTTDTNYKLSRGGKGVGRLLWLDAFEKVSVSSIFSRGSTCFKREFKFKLTDQDQIHPSEPTELTKISPSGTIVTFQKLRGTGYRTKFPNRDKTISKHFGSHFFADFILGKSPTVTLDIDGESTIFPDEIAKLKIEDRGLAKIVSNDFGELEIASFVCHKSASTNFEGSHQMHLVANGRTVVTKKIDGLIGIGKFGPDEDWVYHGCISGAFLDDRVNQERTQFNFDETIAESIIKECTAYVRDHVMQKEVAKFDEVRLVTLREFVQEYPSFGFEDAPELLKRTPKNAIKAEQFAQALIPIRIRRDKERNDTVQKIVSQIASGTDFPADFSAEIRKATDAIKAEEQRQLTEYVMRRKTVLEVLDSLIRRIRDKASGSQDFHLESTLHQFICPMKLRGDDPSKIEHSDHDLWVIDERLTFAKFFASDVPFTQILKDQSSTQRPDLLIFDRLHGLGAEGEDPLKRVVLIEFKQPGRKNYDERYSPMNQVSEYITRLQSGEVEDFENNRIRVADDCVYFCYVIADIVGKLRTSTNGWPTTSNGQGRYLPLSGSFRGVIEIIEWKDLLLDAKLRNHAFIHKAGLRLDRHP